MAAGGRFARATVGDLSELPLRLGRALRNSGGGVGAGVALDSPSLQAVLNDVASGKIQLPDFQREWKWDDDRIRALLATVTLDYPLGVVMTLATGGEAQFKARPLAGTQVGADQVPEQLLLDGQQRLTSLYQALRADQPVATVDARGRRLER